MPARADVHDRVAAVPPTVFAAAAILVAAALFAAAGWLPEIGAAQRAARQQRIETENAAACARLGLGDAAPAHGACLNELRALRQQDREADEAFL